LFKLAKFWGIKKIENKLNVYLLLTPRNSEMIGGGANIGKNAITIEGANKKFIDDYILVILHEIAHFWEKGLVEKLLKGRRLKNIGARAYYKRDMRSLITELALVSLIPDGYIREIFDKKFKAKKRAEKYLEKREEKEWIYLQALVVYEMYDTAKDYIENEKKLDVGYINKILEVIKKIS